MTNFPATRIISTGGEFFIQNEGNMSDNNVAMGWTLLNLSNKSEVLYNQTSKIDYLTPHETLQLPIIPSKWENDKNSLMLVILTQNIPNKNSKFRIYLRNSDSPNWIITTKDLLSEQDWRTAKNSIEQLNSRMEEKYGK